MGYDVRRGWRQRVPLLVSGALVLGMGVVGLWAGLSAGAQAQSVNRADRFLLQRTLAGLTAQYTKVAGAEMVDLLTGQAQAGATAWAGVPGSPADLARIHRVAQTSRSMDGGALLLDPVGAPLVSWSPPGVTLPPATDPGWTPLRQAAQEQAGVLPVSGVLHAGVVPMIAIGVPVQLAGGRTGLMVGLQRARTGALQRYVQDLVSIDGRRGYVVDSAGLVVAGPDPAQVGHPLPYPALLAQLGRHHSGVVDHHDGGVAYVSSFAPAPGTGWTSVTVQDRRAFSGALDRSSHRVVAAVVLLLLIAGGSMVVLNRRRESALRHLALRDELTGVYNRRGWFVLAEHELERARRAGQQRSLVFADLDGLKQVNDALGHREGDRAIRAAAQVLTSVARASDLVGRLDGDEFVLLMNDGQDVGRLLERVKAALAHHNAHSPDPFELRLSLGTQVWDPDRPCDLDELVGRADLAMYADKRGRPGRHDGVVRVPNQRHSDPVGS